MNRQTALPRALLIASLLLVSYGPGPALASDGPSMKELLRRSMNKVLDEEHAKLTVRIAAGDMDARLERALLFRQAGQFEAAQAELRAADDLGDARAHWQLVKGYEYGTWPHEPTAESTAIEQAARQGKAAAMFHLGLMLEHGLGQKQDLAAARSWYQQAAERGDKRGLAFVGRSYDPDTSKLTPNRETALAWYDRAAAANDARGLYNWAITMKVDLKAPADQYLPRMRKSAALGYPPAQSALAALYFEGTALARSDAQALELAERAAKAGDAKGFVVMAQVHQRNGKLAEARDALDQGSRLPFGWGESALRLGRLLVTEDSSELARDWKRKVIRRLDEFAVQQPDNKEIAEVLLKLRIVETMQRAKAARFDTGLQGRAAAQQLICLQADLPSMEKPVIEEDLFSLFATVESHGVKLEEVIASTVCTWSMEESGNALVVAFDQAQASQTWALAANWFPALDRYFTRTRGTNAPIDELLQLRNKEGQTELAVLDEEMRESVKRLLDAERGYRKAFRSAPTSVTNAFVVNESRLQLDTAAASRALGVDDDPVLWRSCSWFVQPRMRELWTKNSDLERQGKWRGNIGDSMMLADMQKCEAVPNWRGKLDRIAPYVVLDKQLQRYSEIADKAVRNISFLQRKHGQWCKFDGRSSPRSAACKFDIGKASNFAVQWTDNRKSGTSLEQFEAAASELQSWSSP
ncbi:tetratricopeptide repeat protein [Roseateles violae]|uniref:Tetratricopeptide repeat protein n=1 Tax=Roseateles violae TaxID=3058042 RepID=A0ABT8DR36_9BURK|nr:tetratricopeptide repeat protein [Pelomonas sp. PFR6]MDN3919543.1 tetratricopeptide repeat protein [Pelomonas sp. PFR6]